MCRYMHFRVDYRAILCYFFKKVDSQGFEPQLNEPKSLVLPLHHESLYCYLIQDLSLFLSGAKIQLFL